MALSPVIRPTLAVVATHGLTDIGCNALLPSYLLCLGLPLPTEVVTVLFCAASVLHLALEARWLGSLALHLIVAALAQWRGNDVAFSALLSYFALVHTPLHYARECRRGNGVMAALAASAGVALACVWAPATFVLTNGMQRIVVAHVVVVYVTSLQNQP